MAKQFVRTAPKYIQPEVTSVRDVCHELRYILVLDTETTLDFNQSLRIAGYCIYDTSLAQVREEGFLYDVLYERELHTLQAYVIDHQMKLWKRQDFISKRFYPLLFKGASWVNHNIKFDIGTLAVSWFYPNKDTIAMVLCNCLGIYGYDSERQECKKHPSICVQHLPSGKYLFSIATDTRVGAIIDTMQLGKALLGAAIPGSLKDMGIKFKCKKVKFISDTHGQELTEDYLRYTHNDVEATLELFLAELAEYHRHHLTKPLASLVSEASVGKAYLEKAGIIPFYQRHSNVPQWYEQIAARCYKGARSEVMHRLQAVEIAYLDFMSQYPCVNALLDLQSLLLASSVSVQHVTEKIQRFVNNFQLSDLQKKETWKRLRVFVKIQPEGDILTVESKEEGDMFPVIRNTALYAPEGWYTLCDVVGSIIRTGKTPLIIDAVEMIPYGRVATKEIKFYDNEQFVIDLRKDDMFASLIDIRSEVKKLRKKHDRDSDEYGYYDSLQNGMKLVANSTSYGALCETREIDGRDIAGKYAVYAIASHITAGGRLLLAIAETLGSQHGLKYVMCDTDSMAFAKPSEMERSAFMRHIETICHWFTSLSPFKSSQDIFELEAVNGDRPLYFMGVSSKRYAVFHLLNDGTIHIRKATVNGVGYVNFDRSLPFPEDIPNPQVDKRYQCAEGAKPLFEYQYLLWYRAIQQVLQGVKEVKVPIEPWSQQIVRHGVALNTPHVLKQYMYIQGVRPFAFFTQLPNKPGYPHSYYLTGVNTSQEIEQAVLYRTGMTIQESSPQFKYLYEQFADYFIHPEAKVLDGTAIGWLEKKPVHINEVSERYRKGKEVLQQETLFDLLNT